MQVSYKISHKKTFTMSPKLL